MLTQVGSALAVLALVAVQTPADSQQEDAFGAKLNFLRGQDAREVGREGIVAEYEKLIEENPGHPLLAEAMMDVGACWEAHNPEKGFRQDPKMALEWFRRAVAAAPPGSEVWFRSRFYVEGRVVWTDTAEARRILKDIADNAKGDSLILARVERELQIICVREGDLDTAEGHCRRLLDWYRDPNRIPKEGRKKSDVDITIASSGAYMCSSFANAHDWPKAERKRRIMILLNDYAGMPGLWDNAHRSLKQLEKMSEPMPKPDPTPPPSAASSRLPLIGVGALAVAGLGAGLFLYRYRRRAHA